MRSTYTLQLLIICVLTFSCGAQHQEAQEKSQPPPQSIETLGSDEPKLYPARQEGKNYVVGEILVKFRDGTTDAAIKAIKKELHLETIRIVSKPNLYLMKILDKSSVESVSERLRNYDEVQYSEPNYIRTIN